MCTHEVIPAVAIRRKRNPKSELSRMARCQVDNDRIRRTFHWLELDGGGELG